MANEFVIKNGLIVQDGTTVITGSLTVTGGVTGSFTGSITNATTASYTLTASFVQTAQTASYILQAVSSSYALTASYALNGGGGSSTITVADEGTAQGTATFLNFTGAGVSVSVASSTASITIPGGAGSTFPYTGSAIISGSLTVTGSSYLPDITGSLFGTASWATNTATASYVATSSWSENSVTSSYTIDQGTYYPGTITGSTGWSQTGTGQVNLPNITVGLYDNPNFYAPLKLYPVTGGTTGTGGIPSLTDNTTNYIFVKYNGGSPVYDVTLNFNDVTNSDSVMFMIVYRLGNFVHTLEFGDYGAGLAMKSAERTVRTDRFARESGLELGLNTSTGVATVNSGAAWNGPYRQFLDGVNSQTDIFFKNYHSASVWTYTTSGDFINISVFDNGINTQSVDPGKYLTNWYYRGQEVNDHIYEVFSTDQYDSISQAEQAIEPELPSLVSSHAFLVGRIIVQSGSYSSGIVQSAFARVFPSLGISVHNDLVDIQGGNGTDEYYHLTQTQFDNIALQNTNNQSLTGSFSGSLIGTASWAENSLTASYVTLAQTASYVTTAQTASYVLNAVSSSFASTASFVRNAETASYVQTAQTASYVLNAISSSYAASASLAQNANTASFVATASWANNAITASYILQAVSSSYATSASQAQNANTASFVATASWANNAVTASYVLNAISSSYSDTASYVELAQTASFVATASWSENAITASYILQAISASYASTASYVLEAISSSFASTASYVLEAVSSSFASTASYVLQAVSSSFSTTSSYALNADLLDGKDSTVFATTGSNLFIGTQAISGALQLNPTGDPGGSNTTSSFFFVSSSGDNTEFNLHYRNNGNLWETHWLEERVDTGLVWGGVLTFTGTTMSITPGAGLIINHNANTSSHGDTVATYVEFGPITASATFITSSQVTYLLIDTDGSLIQQTNIFTPEQFNEKLPLGYIFCLTTSSISSYADARTTTYGQDEQQSQFIRAFGPLKVSGYDITPQSGSLKVSIASGRAYRYGGFYTQNPNSPSIYDSANVPTGSFVRVYRDPAVVGGFRATLSSSGFPFTDIDPTMWDDGSGTLQAVGASEWTIQRVFQGVVNNISYVYYGQNKYDSLNTAIQSITTEPFEEAQTSILALPFIGYVITRGNTTDLGDTTNNTIINSGLFRNTAGSSGGGGLSTTTLNDLSDVTITSPSTGQALVYNAGIWINGTPLNSTSASYAETASYVQLAQTASYIQTAQTASYVLQAVSASYASTASYISNAISASYASTASYVSGMIVKSNAVANTSFTGNPKKATITFSTAFPDTNYSVIITGEDSRTWTIESKLAGSFVINANSNTALTGNTYWQAVNYGEYKN